VSQHSPAAINNEVGGFNAPIPSAPFLWNGDSWGAWELAVRYSNTDLNWHTTVASGAFGGQEKVVTIALNWYLYRDIRLTIDDNIVIVDKGIFAAPTRQNPNLNIVGVRRQFAN
jgi:phosphate-selective porin OprO/OprP